MMNIQGGMKLLDRRILMRFDICNFIKAVMIIRYKSRNYALKCF